MIKTPSNAEPKRQLAANPSPLTIWNSNIEISSVEISSIEVLRFQIAKKKEKPRKENLPANSQLPREKEKLQKGAAEEREGPSGRREVCGGWRCVPPPSHLGRSHR
ncbi:hypothetical protein VOLCADRAFT_96715 [Volvox carteri f. nagariensis]|uniref:Uncharacterized protein n=1 Tax=Volvox carteri f. nagariensis TaxID=3068 RepID=D8UAV5_VOLCA|nr:uncharacterized protein VOLCADRAFT_96715 [Volvox carteri f. nagariensis]EFJ43224.1 hypothetical protein VOLCADRAFT_96715 [Volvox carteri f. nagariensis]|eukprot:XP_002955799.1 hypothetical protein VOLCADRAFT_96715 [Volvox carteri f. nagariensis]